MAILSVLRNIVRLRRAQREFPLHNPALPARADIEPTTICNFHCPHCPTSAADAGAGGHSLVRRHMSLPEFDAVLQQLPAVYRVKLVGLGEPLLNPDFFDMVRAARRRRLRVLTTTNGSLLDADRRRELLSCGLNTLNISVDAANPETHARLRPGSDLDQIAEGIAALVRERRRRQPVIRVWHVIQREAVPELPDLVSRCIEWGADALLCTAKLTNFGYSSLEEVVGQRRALADDLSKVLPEARQRAAAAGLAFRCPDAPPPPRKPDEGRPCRWPWSRTFITALGEVAPCPYSRGPDGLVLGPLLDYAARPAAGRPTSASESCHPERSEGSRRSFAGAGAFLALWNGPAIQTLRESIRTNRNPAFCRACYPGWPVQDPEGASGWPEGSPKGSEGNGPRP